MRYIFILFITFLFSLTNANTQDGTIRGVVFDEATGEYLPGVTIFIAGTSIGTITDLDGNFNLSLAPGKYNLRVSYISYETLNINDIEVKAGEVVHLGELKLQEASISLNSVTVTARQVRNTENALMAIKMKSVNLVDGISAVTLKRTGDSDAATAMKRVSGVSVTGGKYVYVRGLGDRYTKTLLNGVDIPGLDPDRNTLQMDIFPTNIIDNIIVHKSFSAYLPADFTGGIVDIELKDFPSEEVGKVSLSFGYNSISHFNNDFLTYAGGKTDFLGFDDGTRAIPATENIPQFAEVVGNPDGEKGLRYKQILTNFNPTMAAMKQQSFMDFDFGISYGNQVPKEKVTLGYNLSLSYKNSTDFYEDAIDGKYGLSGDINNFDMDRREYQKGDIGINQVLLSGLIGFAVKTQKSKYRINLLHLQNGESKAGIFDFIGSDQGSDFLAYQHNLDYSQRSLSNLLIDGHHSFEEGKWRVVWKVSPTFSKLEDPDVRFTRYEVNDNGSVRIGTEVGFPERIWRELDEINLGGLVHVTREYSFNKQKAKLQFGGGYSYKERDYIIRNFSINPRGDFPLTGDPNELFFEENLWPRNDDVGSGTTYETPFIPNNPNEYNANSSNISAYVSTELGLSQKLKAFIGLRIESFQQFYTGSDQLRSNVLENEKVLDNMDLFPSVNLIYSLATKQNLRLSYTRTTARPSFKELSYAEIYDPISGNTFIGGFHEDVDDVADEEYWDGNLVSTYIQNFDIRWELFHGNGEMVSFSLFYKTFNKPIEIVQYTKQIGAFQPRNVGDGQVFGVEIEFRQNLAFITESLKTLKVSANSTIAKSIIKMSSTEYQSRIDNARTGQSISENREMAGQAPYIINAGLSFDGQKEGFWGRVEAGLYYNVQGQTLEYVGVADRPDIYTKPFHSLNFNSSFGLDRNGRFQLGFKVKNILNSSVEMVYVSHNAADQFFKSRIQGTTYTLGLSYRFK